MTAGDSWAGNGSQELWPTEHSRSLVENLTEYLTTTFALSDKQAADRLAEFLQDPERGMFKGPYVRLRLPFAATTGALDATGKPTSLDFYPADYPPYGHQLAAFQRLTTKAGGTETFRRPEPTLVTTGTGSGKTEAFLLPILDHVVRAKREGITGVKALILYPMNALANDQAGRITNLIMTHPELAGVRAALYTGQEGPERSQVTDEGLITNRYVIRSQPPDILLTNYKMLDQLLLRPEDTPLWQASATSLQYLVLDEFHTYDGAQGTDVAMLLRRLGAALKSYWPADLATVPHGPAEGDRAKPLGHVVPVATSATLGAPVAPGASDPMLKFARTVFGVEFNPEAVVPETRVGIDTWINEGPTPDVQPRRDAEIFPLLVPANMAIEEARGPHQHVRHVLDALFDSPPSAGDPAAVEAALKTHPWTRTLLEHATAAVSLGDLAAVLVPPAVVPSETAQEFLSHLLAVFSHVRKHQGRGAVTVETHLWVREVTRLDSYLDHTAEYLWSDDGEPLDPGDEAGRTPLPAIYCRHCGARGWASMLTPDGFSVEMSGAKIREASVRRDPKFRALMDAAKEADLLERDAGAPDLNNVDGLRFLHTRNRAFVERLYTDSREVAEAHRADYAQGLILAVKMHTGSYAGDLSEKQVCPVCDTADAVRFVGSAIATLLSVAVNGLFGARHLDAGEKKALVFTDSVQDAAHRAGFIQSRSHTFTLRIVLRQALSRLAEHGDHQPSVTRLVDTAMDVADAGGPAARFMLMPPDVAERKAFRDYWDPQAGRRAATKARTAVRRRLLFDTALEFGLQARLGRTLELTGTAVAETDATSGSDLGALGSRAVARRAVPLPLEFDDRERFTHWVRGVLIRMRLQGGIAHPWLENYLFYDGHRWHLWGGRRRDQGMPAFPIGRSIPVFPRVGGAAGKPKSSELETVTAGDAWYAWWARRALGIRREESGHVARALFEELADNDVVGVTRAKDSGATIYTLAPERILVGLTTPQALEAKQHVLQCTACRAKSFGTVRVVEEMTGAPCMNLRCLGTLDPVVFTGQDYYRDTLYGAESATRIVAREHSSLLTDEVRLEYEEQFRSDPTPAAPNVLVATPTLEMGIDIGSLSTVMLSSMPQSVASYVQRVGRAGRLSGNSLALAFVRGRGEHLPKLHDPLSIINGEVRPPATYLDADEILRRQFVAFCGDVLARTADAPRPRNLSQVLRSTDADTYLGRIMRLLRTQGQGVLDAFIGQFGDELSDPAAERLRSWALPGDDGDTELETRLHVASRRYGNDLLEETARKDKLINQVLPALEEELAIAERTGSPQSKAVTEAERAVRSAKGTLRRIEAQITELTTRDWWISGLERYGLFPTYTLIEDTVTLDARISWQDEDTGEWEAEVHSHDRRAQAALNEFAPGSKFYARGMELAVDAVELGHDHRELTHWQICPACGWIKKDLMAVQGSEGTQSTWNLARQCPRCGTAAIADTGQVLPVVVLSRVSADVRRDEAVISDHGDDRTRMSYEILPAADIDAETASRRWYVKGFAFGAELLPDVTVRWLNLGPSGHHAKERTLAGQDVQTPLFRICPSCGTMKRRVDANEHRYWCEYRKSVEQPAVEIALARELTTQGVLLHLPAELVDDHYTIPTLKAALLLGLHHAFGGTPAHLGVIDVPETEQMAAGGYASQTLLLHDNVPGGTGYLAEFSDPARVHALLKAAWERVSACDCDLPDREDDQRLACHRCLLPHADYHTMDRVSRSAAERILATLLAGGAAADEHRDLRWETTEQPPVFEGMPESHLERQFREALRARLETEGATLNETMQDGYLTLRFQLPGQRWWWTLTPQVGLGATRPDFLLTAPGTRGIAIFTDGHAFHASVKHNRLADDAEKRHTLRAEGTYLPWGITHEDVERFRGDVQDERQQLAWLDEGFLTVLPLEPNLLRATRISAMHLLWEWIHNPDERMFAEFAHTIVLATLDLETVQPISTPGGADLIGEAYVDSAVLWRRLVTGMRETDRWWRRPLGHTELFAAGSANQPERLRVVYSLDDTDEAVTDPDHAHHWREWLLLSTVLGFRSTSWTALLTRRSAETILADEYTAIHRGAEAPPHSIEIEQTQPALPPEWQELIDGALDEDEAELLRSLATEQLPLPEVGEEVEDGIPVDLLFSEQRVAVLLSSPGDTEESLQTAGWRVFIAPDADTVAEELRR